jgi:hypothetical protein
MGYYMAIAGGPGDWGRFRHPAMPIICVLAADGLYAVCGRLRPQLQCFLRIFAISRHVGSEFAASTKHLES